MQLAQPAVQLFERQTTTYQGGWPLGYVGSSCPADTPVKCQPYSWYNLNCCPNGQKCSGSWPAHCCPDDEPCETTVMNLPVCANSDWKMYHLGKTDYYFCCPQGMVGLIPDSGRTGICQEEGARVPKSMLATVASQFGAGPTQSSGGAGNGGGTGTTGAPGSGSSGGTNGNGNSNDGDGGTTAGSSGSSNSGGGSGGVSTGAIAGIAVGGVAFLALVVALLLWFHRRSLRRHPATERAGAAHPPNLPQEPLKDVGAAQVHHVQGQHDVSQAVQYPMYSSLTPQGAAPAYNPPRTVAEVAAVSRAYEMEASRPSNAAGGKE